jgi:hypothetical protein
MSSKDNLENLARSGGLKPEPPDRKECEGLLRSAIDRLKDAHNPALSFASRFDLSYNVAHALADKRYLVFQCLVHTLDVGKAQVRLFALCHERRNLAEYEGYMGVDEALLADLLAATDSHLAQVQKAMADAE